MGSLDGKVVIVTGGASGIGLATATRLRDEGAELILTDLNEEAGTVAAAELDARFVRADVGRSSDWERVVADAEATFGGIDHVFLNAGVTTQQADITAISDDQIRRVFGANVDGVLFGTRAVVPALERRGGGSIVATASLAGIIAFAPDPLYTATKHAVVGFVRSVAAQLEPRRIRINAVCPGIVDTPLVGPARENLKAAGFPMIPPEEIADAVVGRFTGTGTGECVVCQPGRPAEVYQFSSVPGPATPGDAGRRPPGM